MALQSMTALATITLQSASASVSFSGIPQNYRDLVLVLNGMNTTDDVTFSLRINEDSTANYSYVTARGRTTNLAQSSSLTSQTSMFIAGWSYGQGTTKTTPVLMQFMDYSVTDKHKTMINRYQTNRDNGDGEVGMIAGRWASTSAINSISLFPNSSTFKAGTTASLYGRIA
jgi:hypothetical protein